MEIVIDLLVLLVVVQTSLRLSQWTNGWLRIAFCVTLGIAVYLCTDYAAGLSKLQMAAWLHDTSVLQNIAILCLLDALLTFSPLMPCIDFPHARPFENKFLDKPSGKAERSWLSLNRKVHLFPFLIFPAVFYVLCQLLFTMTGTDFHTVGLLLGIVIALLLPLLSKALSWLLPQCSDRSLLHLAVTIILCLACLINAQGAANSQFSILNSQLNANALAAANSSLFTLHFSLIMDYVSKLLFGIANILLIPDILLLIIFFIRSLILLVTTYKQYTVRQRDGGSSLYTKYSAMLRDHEPDEAYGDYLVAQLEVEAAKDVNLSRLLTKLGPVLGLIGTLISMSPALVGLSTGDISGMAYNMQVVFSATVVGLVISIVGLFTQQLKSRWYQQDISRLEYECAQRNSKCLMHNA